MIRFHLYALFLGAILDLIIGDPHSIPHPVIFIGKLISCLDGRFQKKAEIKGKTPSAVSSYKTRYGRRMALIVTAVTAAISGITLFVCYRIHPLAGLAAESVMTCQILAGRSLQKESMKVYDRLKYGTLEEARKAVSMIVGRDTRSLSRAQVAKAAVETVAENASDGVIAPMLYTALGGPVLGWTYKAVNTMDSMVGYKNDKYMDFGRGPAHLDDAANYLPSRISALLMISAAWILCMVSKITRGQTYPFDAGNAARIWVRDRRKHASPNSAQTESVMAGALGLQLAGDAYYFGKLVRKPFIGDPIRQIEAEDIPRANHLMLTAAALSWIICMLLVGIAA